MPFRPAVALRLLAALVLACAGPLPGADAAPDDARIIATLLERLTPAARAALGADLEPDGHELAQRLLRPLATGQGPMTPEAMDAAARKAAGNRGQLDTLLRHRVSLLGGYPVQDLGDPIDWFRAPKDDWQWTTHLSRHYWLRPLAQAWRASRDARHSGAVIDALVDWVRRTPLDVPTLKWGGKRTSGAGIPATAEGFFKGYVDGPWTSLSAESRIATWSELLAFLWDAPQMTNAHAALLLNSLLGDHRVLALNHERWGTANQYIAIADALVHLSWWYPDFQDAVQAEQVGWERVLRFTTTQVYADGSMAECSPNYSIGSLKRLFDLMQGARERHRPVPEPLTERVRLGMRYFLTIADPLGNAPRIAKGKASLRAAVGGLNSAFADPEAAWFASAGREGRAPAVRAHLFPWVGHAVLRSGWDADATWIFFEPGPRGSGHHDLACLNLHLIAHGEPLLTDPGFYSYSATGDESTMAIWLKSSAAHNVALVDGEGQIPFAPTRKGADGRPLTASRWANSGPNGAPGDYLWNDAGDTTTVGGSYAHGFGDQGRIPVVHRRTLRYVRSANICEITDEFTGVGEHRIDLHWQCSPRAQVTVAETGATIAMSRARLRLATTAPTPVTVRVLKGDKEPLAGWFSEAYGKLEAAPMVRVTATATLPLRIVTRLEVEALTGVPR